MGKHQLIDEWQLLPSIWDYVRRKCDEDKSPGKYILTGSATEKEGTISHSGAGRICKIDMYTMSLYESGDRRVPSIMIDKICDEFKCHKAEILGMDYLNKKSDDNRTILFDIYDNLPQDLKDLLLVRAKELDNINKENLKVAA